MKKSRKSMMILLTVLLTGMLFAAVTARAAGSGMTVEATGEKIVLHVEGIGKSGTAQIVRFGAEAYHTKDALHGMSTERGAGTKIADYACGEKASVEFPRFNADGTDHLYDKYYVVQKSSILAGPVYASEIASARSVGALGVKTKKGLVLSNMDVAKEMGIGNTIVNWDLCSTIYANEDADGNPVDNSGRNAYTIQVDGETFYFSRDYVDRQDEEIAAFSKAGINVTLVIISWEKYRTETYPEALRYDTDGSDRQTLGFNTGNARGRKYWTAFMEFIADRYSRSAETGLVDQYIVGNEIDYTYDWYLMAPLLAADGTYNRVDFDVFMEEFTRTFRLANAAVKKYNAKAKVLLSLTHNWKESPLTAYGDSADNNTKARYNTYPPKDIVDWMAAHEAPRGDYDWGLSVHPYPVGTTSSNPAVTDLTPKNKKYKPVTGDADTTPWITVSNLEIYQIYLDRPENQYHGQTRTVSITEGSICTLRREKATEQQLAASWEEQAATVAMMYYRAANIPCINIVCYFQLRDQLETTYMLGLTERNGTRKPSFYVWKYIDTDQSFVYADQYLKCIAPEASSYRELMELTKSDFDWDKAWSEKNIAVRKAVVGTEEPPVIKKQPAAATVTEGETAAFSVTASGSGLRYRWEYRKAGASAWTEVAGADGQNASCSIAADKGLNKAEVRCIVSNGYGSVASYPALLSVNQVLPFEDVPAGASYKKALIWAYSNGVVKGKDSSHFAPSGNCTRGEFCTMLWRMNGSPDVSGLKNPFKDVTMGKGHSKGIVWCASRGIINGYKQTDGTVLFKSANKITRTNMIVMLFKMARSNYGAEAVRTTLTASPFKDIKDSNGNLAAFKWAYAKKISAPSNGRFEPAANCTRWQLVTFLYRYNNQYHVMK